MKREGTYNYTFIQDFFFFLRKIMLFIRMCVCACVSVSLCVLRITPKCMCALSVATPMSLQQLSRLALRRELGTKALKVVGQLHIPKLIISYLCYE